MSSEPNTGFDQLWVHVDQNWDDERAHRAFLEYALAENRLADAAARYRQQSALPERATIAKVRLEAILTAATGLLARRPERDTKRESTRSTIAAVMAVVVLGLLAAWILR